MSDSPRPPAPLDSIISDQKLAHAPADAGRLGEFKPWHLPRKLHVRREQWARSAEALFETVPDGKVITYLCLPGEDLLDVQELAVLCERKGRRLRYLGFDESRSEGPRSTQLIASEQIVRQIPSVEETSEVVAYPFSSVAHPDSRSNRYLRDQGPFDVVNLDMCDAFTSSSNSPTHDAVVELVTHQCNSRAEPWLLFLTTRAERSRIASSEFDVYLTAIADNALASKEFADRLASICSMPLPQGARELCAALSPRIDADTMVCGQLLTLGIGKWLLGVAVRRDPWRVDLLSTWAYRTGLTTEGAEVFAAGQPNLFSLGFQFTKGRVGRSDPTGLARAHDDASQSARFAKLDERILAEKMARSVHEHTRDVDAVLQADEERYAELTAQCAKLLADRNYSPAEYLRWVARVPRVGETNGRDDIPKS